MQNLFSVCFASLCFCHVAITKCVTLFNRHDKGHAFLVTLLEPGTSVATWKQLLASFQKFPTVFRRVKKGMAKNMTGSVDDLATLSELNEKIILEELQARYSKDVIYVSSTYRALSLSVYNTTHLMRFSFLVQFVIIFSCSGC